MRFLPFFVTAIVLALANAVSAERLTDAPLVTPAWLAAHIDHDALLVIDLRDPVGRTDAYAAGHVPGAVSAPYAVHGWREMVDDISEMLPPPERIAARIGALGVSADKQIVIVAEGIDSNEFGKATRVYWTLRVLGHDAVAILDGGFRAWEAVGLPVSTEPVAPEPAVFHALLRPELVADQDDVRAALDGGAQLVDGRPEAQFAGRETSGSVARAGTLPGAVNLPHGRLYDGERFADAATMARLAGAAGIAPDVPAIAFCNTGHWASIAWFALSEVWGHPEVAMYDGSMAEWTRDPGNPVVVR